MVEFYMDADTKANLPLDGTDSELPPAMRGSEKAMDSENLIKPPKLPRPLKPAKQISPKNLKHAKSLQNAKTEAPKAPLPPERTVARAFSRKLTVEWVDSFSKVPAYLWREFFPETVEGKFWYATLEQSKLEGQFLFLYALVKEGPEIVAIAPAFVMNVPIELVAPEAVANLLKILGPVMPSLTYQRTLFFGSACADEGTIGLRKDVALCDVVLPLQEAAEKKAASLKAPMIVWKDFPDTLAPHFDLILKTKQAFSLVSFPGAAIPISGDTDEDYFVSLKRSRRYNLKKKLKKSKSVVDIKSSVIQRPDEATLQEVFALFWQTYEKGKTKFEKLNLDFFRLIAETENAWFVLLRDEKTEKLLAFMLCFKLGDKVINKFIGIDYDTPADYFLYFRLWEVALNWVISQKAVEFQSGQTGYRAKIEIGNELVPLTNYCKHTNPIMNLIYAKVASNVSWTTLDADLADHLKAHPDAESEED